MKDSVQALRFDIVSCERCPRLRAYCLDIAREKRKAFRDQTYWGKPVPNFGADQAEFMIVGLAPAAHGANRTARMFTGDRSGEWLYRALYKAGFANQPNSDHAGDELELINCVITATAHCAPPENKPTPAEIENCSEYLDRSLQLYKPRVLMALGLIGWNAVIDDFKKRGLWVGGRPKFGHGAEVQLPTGAWLIGSYHPSQQNTFTGKLTEPMFDAVFARVRKLMEKSAPKAPSKRQTRKRTK